MKKIIILILAAVTLLFLSDFFYEKYKRNERVTVLTEDRAVIFVYINIDSSEIKNYFDLEDSQYLSIKDGYRLECVVPNYSSLNLINSIIVDDFDLSDIRCDTEFNFSTQFEMKKEYKPVAYNLTIKLSEKLRGKALAAKQIYVPWEYGKINHIVVEKEKAYMHCTN